MRGMSSLVVLKPVSTRGISILNKGRVFEHGAAKEKPGITPRDLGHLKSSENVRFRDTEVSAITIYLDGAGMRPIISRVAAARIKELS
jgi:hypothetical protein